MKNDKSGQICIMRIKGVLVKYEKYGTLSIHNILYLKNLGSRFWHCGQYFRHSHFHNLGALISALGCSHYRTNLRCKNMVICMACRER